MKSITLVLLTVFSLNLFAYGEISFGRGLWVCAAEGFDKYPSMARSQSRLSAKAKALEKCAEYEGNGFFCEVMSCEKDNNVSSSDINFRIVIGDGKTSIKVTNASARYACSIKTFGEVYYAEAPTKLEAMVLTKRGCVENGKNGIFCDVESKDCEEFSAGPSQGDFRIDLGSLFN